MSSRNPILISHDSVQDCSCLLCSASAARAQGPAPETAPPLFPGGRLISYNSIFTTRGVMPSPRTAFRRGTANVLPRRRFQFHLGLSSNFDLTVIAHRHQPFIRAGSASADGTGLGDMLLLVKYRFYRRDSPRGTTQASVTLGPKLPTGRTNLTEATELACPGIAAGLRLDGIFLPRTGPTPASSICGGWWPTKISTP